MTENALGLVKAESFQVPAFIADIGPEATKRYFEFFTVPIHKNTRIAYYHAINQNPYRPPTSPAIGAVSSLYTFSLVNSGRRASSLAKTPPDSFTKRPGDMDDSVFRTSFAAPSSCGG
jgi:hypothetical protein